jgi:hypothetical protein
LAPERLFNKEFEVEHVDPEALGGATVLDNLVLAMAREARQIWIALGLYP